MGHILQECNKFTEAYDGIVGRTVSSVGVSTQVLQALDAFRAQNGSSFTVLQSGLISLNHTREKQ
jgi:peroxiredoxin